MTPCSGTLNLEPLQGWSDGSWGDHLSDEPEYGLLMALETGPQTHAELATRTGLSTGEINHLLHAAQLHSDLTPVFEGLPEPPLYRQPPTQRASWPWILVGLAGGVAIMSLVFAFVTKL